MPMTRDVILSISGFQYETNGDEATEVMTGAAYCFKNGRHFVTFKETVETGETTTNLIKIANGRVDVIRRGPLDVHMVFERGQRNVSRYRTPFGDLQIGIRTLSIDSRADDLKIHTEISYLLDIDDQHVSDCKIVLDIRPKGIRPKGR